MTDDETWVDGDHANTLNRFDVGDTRTTHIVVNSDSYWVEDCENAALRANGSNNGPPRTDKQPLITQTFPIDDGREIEKHQNGTGIGSAHDPAYTLDRQQRPAVVQPEKMSVRRLTPVECERLMGLPDGWTAPEGVRAPDSKRYAACGDAIVTTVAFWIADRIRMIEEEEETS